MMDEEDRKQGDRMLGKQKWQVEEKQKGKRRVEGQRCC
jgi:hypothetical protein